MEILSTKDYEIEQILGEGGFGVVYQVRSRIDSREYAVKAINLLLMARGSHLGGESISQLKELARKEADTMQRAMPHGHIVRIYTSFFEGTSFYLVMELCSLGSLSDLIDQRRHRGGQFSERQVAEWLMQLSLTLMHLHKLGIIHRDIKSQNIFIAKEGILKLGDFGLARRLDLASSAHVPGMGTFTHFPPELVNSQHRQVGEFVYDEKCEIWALGLVAFEIASMELPKLYEKPRIPEQSGVSPQLRGLIENKMLEINPNKRATLAEICSHPCLVAEMIAQNGHSDPFSEVFTQGFNKTSSKASDDSSRRSEPTKPQKSMEEDEHLENKTLDESLYISSKNGDVGGVLEALKNGADVNVYSENEEHWTALHWACSKGNLELAETLIQFGAVVDAETESGVTPLMLASSHGYSDIVTILLDAGAYPNTRDDGGSTALFLAAENCHMKVAEILLVNGADVSIRDNFGFNAVKAAQDAENEELVNLLESFYFSENDL